MVLIDDANQIPATLVKRLNGATHRPRDRHVRVPRSAIVINNEDLQFHPCWVEGEKEYTARRNTSSLDVFPVR